LDDRKEFIDFLLEKYHDLPRALLLIESWLNDRRDLAGALLRTATSESRSLDESRRVEAWDLDTEESNGRQNKQKLHDLLLRLRRGDYPPLLCPATAPKVDAVTAAKHLGVMERTDNLLSLLRRLKTEKLADSEVADGSELFWAVEPQEMTKGAQKEMAETAVEAAKPGASPRVLVEKEPLSVFRRNGEFWEVRLDGADTRAIGLSKGMDHIAYLLSYPNICKAIPALQLQGAAADLPTEVGEDVHGGGSFQPVLDPEAKVSYRKRLLEIEEELAEAREHHDLGRIEKLEEEKASLLEELARAAGWQGKDRQLGPDGPERRAAKAVGNALDRAYSRIEKQVPALAKHLREAIKREGNGFAYRPGPESPDWVLR
jgi:hypothetical protein